MFLMSPSRRTGGLALRLALREHDGFRWGLPMRVNSRSKPRRACLKLVGDDEVLAFADGHDDAIVGVADREGVTVVVYDARLILDALRTRDGMDRDEAQEFFEFNIAGAWIGEQTPIFLRRIGGHPSSS